MVFPGDLFAFSWLDEQNFSSASLTSLVPYQIIWLLAQGKTTKEVMEITGYSQNWIYELVRGYNHFGPDSLGDHQCENQEHDPLLNDVQQAQLWLVLQQPPPDGGLWSGQKVADWMSEILGRKVARQRGWEYLIFT